MLEIDLTHAPVSSCDVSFVRHFLIGQFTKTPLDFDFEILLFVANASPFYNHKHFGGLYPFLNNSFSIVSYAKILLMPSIHCRSEMPLFWRKKNETNKNYEHKIHLARHAPDLVVDVSDCYLSQLPDEVANLCKVLLKQVGYSFTTSFIVQSFIRAQILILSNNKLTSLTTESHADALQGLKETLLKLDCSNNQLKTLPNSLCYLNRLKVNL